MMSITTFKMHACITEVRWKFAALIFLNRFLASEKIIVNYFVIINYYLPSIEKITMIKNNRSSMYKIGGSERRICLRTL